MKERFLRYAAEHGGKLRAVYVLDGAIVQGTIKVTDFTGEKVTFTKGNSKKEITLDIHDLLSCDYPRGDHGEME